MKAINTKKIVALTTGLAMVGATIFGAAAQDLSQYPSPLFIKDGAFDGSIVVGELAKTSDVVGSIELAAGLQTAAVKKTQVAVGAGSSTIDKGIKIDKTGTHVGLNRFLQFVQDTQLDETDLPNLLVDGTFDEDEGATKNSVDYTQDIELNAGSGQLIFTQDDDDAPEAGVYLHFADNANMYNYTLEFDEDVEFTNDSTTAVNDDFETAKLDILGKTYTITEVKTFSSSNKAIDKITFLAGDTTRWLSQDEPLDRELNGATHTFTLVDVNEDEDKCGISVDGTVQWVDVGSTKTINGVQIGVTDAIVVHSAGKDTDVCEVNLGATELVLDDGTEMQLNGVDIEGSLVEITSAMAASGSNTLSEIEISYEPEDELFLKAGDKFIEPIFDSFAFYFDGLNTQKTEMIELTTSGSSANLEFLNSDGKEIKVEWKLNDSNVINFGSSSAIDDRIYLENQACNYVTAITECEGAQFFLITSGGEAHVMEISDFDTADNKITIKDLTYGSSSEDDFNEAINTSQSIDLSSGAGTITLVRESNHSGGATINEALNFTGIDATSSGLAETSLNDEGGISLGGTNATFGNSNVTQGFVNARVFQFVEEVDDGYGNQNLEFGLSYDSTDDDININAPTVSAGSAYHVSAVDVSDDDDDNEYYVTNWSTMILYNSEDDDSLKIEYPDEYRFAQAFIGEAEAAITSAGGLIEAVEIQQIPVGSAKLDRDISDVGAQNMVVVGGPCANSVAAALMGNPADCAEGFKEGEGIIKLFEASSGKVAVLAAGYSAMDTRRATRVLANYKDYAANLKGTEVVVKGTSFTDISVSSVA